jgi:ABC-type maltose transport system permease subunit
MGGIMKIDSATVFSDECGSILIAAPMVIVFLLLQRYFISGLTAGGTKRE